MGLEALREARPAYVEAAAYYDDEVPEVFASARVRRAIARTGMDHGKPYIAMVVDAVVDRMKLAAITSPDQDQAEALQRIWDSNRLRREAMKVHKWQAEYGDAYLIVLPRTDDASTVTGVDEYANDPLTVRMIYSAENPREKAYAVKRWCETVDTDRQIHRAELYYNDRVERWTTKADSAGNARADWEPWLPSAVTTEDGETVEPDDDAWIIEHNYGEIPVFHFRNSEPYGVPEHRRGYGAQDTINKLDATHMGGIDYQGVPQRYALTDAANADTGDFEPADFGDDLFPPDPAAGPSDSGDDSSLKSGPGEVWLLRGFRQVGQFDPAEPAVFYDPLEFNVRSIGVLTTTPLHLLDPTSEQPSGRSVRAQDAPFVEKIKDRQEGATDSWQDSQGFALHLVGFADPVVDVRWHAAETVDDKDSWDTAKVKSELGVPHRQLLVEAGYSDDQVEAWLESPTDDAAELTRRLADLSSLADTVQKLGAAVTLGAIDQAQVQDLIGPVVDAMTGRPVVPPEPTGD
ncbi:phage portal protein [Kitasatospora sp. NPDC048239]|uniref:phage portal protein n=1 Tax=Kitasatospora sp. NPDC048239 TaxID=3364046 RepID=UPI003715B41F